MEPLESLLAYAHRPWYRFGWRSPDILWSRNRVSRWPHRLRMAWQRARHEFSDNQFFSLDYSLARLTVAGVKRLREWQHGYPGELSSWEEWDAILAQIEAGFQAWLDNDGWFVNTDAEASFNRAMSLYAKWFGALWD